MAKRRVKITKKKISKRKHRVKERHDKVRLYSIYDGRYFGKRVVYHGPVNEYGDRSEYYIGRDGKIYTLESQGLEVYPEDRRKIVWRSAI